MHGYRIYRGASPYTQTLLASVRNTLGYHDASAGPSVYFYRVAAFNDSGEGPSSPLVGMIGRTGAAGAMAGEGNRRHVMSHLPLRPTWAARWA
ncbi:MAG: hypothetical protein M3203_12730 [Actinomycetota bacterium]|nr:hypothetical protein [Actinomycetota bacterium]